MRRLIVTLLIVMIGAGAPRTAFAYLKYGVQIGDRTFDVRWTQLPVRYFVTERPTPQVTSQALVAAIERAFATWQRVPSATVRAEFQGLTTIPPGFVDDRSTFGFLDRPDLDRVLGATSFLFNEQTGQLVEADVFFNTRFTWSTADGGEQGRIDLESVALHEIGHLFGLGHSAIGETEALPGGGRRVIASGAVMFPVAMSAGAIADRVLQPDDIAGIGDLYPSASFPDATGSISGTVTKNGGGVFGAHVAAFHLQTGRIVGNFALNDRGEFVIAGLEPGPYVVRAEPLDDVDLESFFTTPVDVSFQVGYATRLLVVPAGGNAGPVSVAVQPK